MFLLVAQALATNRVAGLPYGDVRTGCLGSGPLRADAGRGPAVLPRSSGQDRIIVNSILNLVIALTACGWFAGRSTASVA